jgi:hypothetical protein
MENKKQTPECEISGSHGGDFEVKVVWDVAPVVTLKLTEV